MSWTVPGYEPVRELGSGAAGTVVLARHEATGTTVAIKYLDPALAQDVEFLPAFRAEARLLGDVDDPNVAALYEYVQAGGQAAIVLEFVDGVPLRALLDGHAPLTPEAALAVLKGSLLGLAAAHAHGVVHRDYKPDNVLVTPAGTTKLVDFGVAVRAGRDAPAAGTPQYMSPEQWTGGPASPASDVYAATCVFVESVTGQRPFTAPTVDGLRRQHLHAEPLASGVPDAVRGLVRSGLAKDPTHRPAHARAFVAELERVAQAEYGADWEARGRRELRRLVLLLAALLPAGGAAAAGLAAFARTVLGRGRWAAAGLAGAVLVGGTAAATTTGGSPTRASGPVALATSTPSLGARGPSAGSPSATPARSATRTGRSRPTHRAESTAPTSTDPTAASSSAHRTAPPPSRSTAPRSHHPHPTPPRSTTSTVTPPPALTITIVKGKSRLDQVGTTTDGDVNVSITASDGRPFTVTIEYGDGSASSVTESGSTYYAIHQTHAFPSCGGTWSYTVTTDPAASDQPLTVSTESSC